MRPSDPMAAAALARVQAMVGEPMYEEIGEFPVERGYIWTSCASVENGNPLYWDDAVAEAITDGPIAPPTMLSVWFRPHSWAPGREAVRLPLQVHFDLKELLGLPEAVISDNTIVFYDPVRIGDVLRTRQILRSVSEEKTTKLGSGRFWVIEVESENQRGELVGVESYTAFGYVRADSPGTDLRQRSAKGSGPAAEGEVQQAESAQPERAQVAEDQPPILEDVVEGGRLPSLSYDVTATTVVLGALASRDWRPMHHDKDFAVNRNGTKDIFLNTPAQAAWFERYVTDWTGPRGRLGRMSFRMRGSVFPGDTMVFDSVVSDVGIDDVGCGWVGLAVMLAVDGDVKTSCNVRVALPVDAGDNPWKRRSERWRP